MAFDVVRPRRRVRVFEVGHEDAGAGVERVDDHLPLDRSGDLDAAVEQVVRDRRDGPVAFADLARLGEKVRKLAGIEASLALFALRQQLLAARAELTLQRSDELEHLGGQDHLPLGANRRANFDLRHAVKY